MSSSHGGGGDFEGVTVRCFSSKEMVTQVLRNGSGNHIGHLHLFGLLVVVDVSSGRLHEISREAATLVRIKHQVPCRVVCLMDLKTSSEDLMRFREVGSCDLDLRKPIHGSRLRNLFQTMRYLQASPFQQQHPYQAGIAINELPAADQTTGAASETTCATLAARPRFGDDKPLEGMHVLVVEDTVVLQTIQKKMLTTLGAAVEIAGDGSKAVAMFKKALENANGGVPEIHVDTVALPYDVVFMDCQMPVIDGYETTKRIREEESRYGIRTPIIALTAHSEEEDLQETIQAGMDLHLTKPIQRLKIVEAVYQVCVCREDKN